MVSTGSPISAKTPMSEGGLLKLRFSSLRHRCLCRYWRSCWGHLDYLLLKLSTLSLPDESYLWNALYALNLISTFFLKILLEVALSTIALIPLLRYKSSKSKVLGANNPNGLNRIANIGKDTYVWGRKTLVLIIITPYIRILDSDWLIAVI
jgi:hypothetical protein